MDIVYVDSEAADMVGYDKEKRILRIRFNSGKIYEYLQVPFLCYMALLETDSVGHFINWTVKPHFPYRVIPEWT
jgi:hypothetical protein